MFALKAVDSGTHYSSEELVNGIARNNEAVLEYIYENNLPAVMSYVLKNNGDESDARDIFQEAIIAVWSNIRDGRFQQENGSSIGGYLFQVARNKWLDKVRSKPYKSTVRFFHADTEGLISPEESQAEEERILYLQHLYNNLGEKCKAILHRFYFERKSLSEIADQLSHDAESLRTMKYRCMKKLREMHLENETIELKEE
jgi:RNA polymerase sigma factor (sigma-70 family)